MALFHGVWSRLLQCSLEAKENFADVLSVVDVLMRFCNIFGIKH
jgi:hypothetical protein